MEGFGPSLPTVLTSVSYAMLALQICDWFNGLPFEIGFVWRKGCSLPKGLYFFSQYVSLAAQIMNILAMRELFKSDETILPRLSCQSWYMFVVVVAELLLVSLEIAVIHRVYAMFDKSKSLLTLLLLLVIGELTVVITLPLKYLLRDEVVGKACEVSNHMPLIVLVIPMFQIANQCLLFFLQLSKVGIKGVPILSLMIKDGALLFMSCFVLMGAVSVQITLSSLNFVSPHAYHGLFPVYVGIISILTCHLIRHMEEASRTQSSAATDAASFLLTSIAATSVTESISTAESHTPSDASASACTSDNPVHPQYTIP